MKLNDAADLCIAHGIDGFVLLALLDEEDGLESIGVISAVDKAKVRGGIRKISENDDGGGLHRKAQGQVRKGTRTGKKRHKGM